MLELNTQSQQHLGCTLNINSFEFIVGFYSRDHKMYRTFSWKLRSWLISILTLSKWTHCSFQLGKEDFDSSLFGADGKEASLVRTESLHAYFGKPDKEVSLGIIEFEISDYDKVENYFNTKPKRNYFRRCALVLRIEKKHCNLCYSNN